ncbi:MAG: DUF2147 domain-containing protein [Sphingobium sp.]|nr:DUF2147 domain-containing protein [Sphingobium sp.]
MICLVPVLAPAMMAARAPAPPMTNVIGRWINPKGSVTVETQPCGAHLCGKVDWVSADALKDARDAGVPSPIGIQLLQDYARSPSGVWHGRVYVPDLGRTFSSTITVENPDTLKISGCILAGLICKSQLWHRQS